MASRIPVYGKRDKLLNSSWPHRYPGRAYAFLRTNAVGGLGHIGWGFEVCDGQVCFGGTENPENAELDNAIAVGGVHAFAGTIGKALGSWHQGTGAQGGDNQAWIEIRYPLEMFMDLKLMAYDYYKIVPVLNPSPERAYKAAVANLSSGFTGLTNNCLDATHRVLTAYGAKGMPSPQIPTNYAPVWYFNNTKALKQKVP